MARIAQRDKDTAGRLLAALAKVGCGSWSHMEECERVLSLGIPLARMIDHDMIDKVSREGREHLDETLQDLEIIADFSAGSPDASIRSMWDYRDRMLKARADRR